MASVSSTQRTEAAEAPAAGSVSDAANPAAKAAAQIGADVRLAVVERVAAGQVDLPLLPQIAGQVVSLAGSPQVDAAQLSALIHRDPALAGQVLRIANSPTYMPRMPIVSLQQAVARLGLGVVSEIAFVASVQTGTFKVPGFEAELRRLWRHALASGVFAKEVARLRRSNVEAAFLCGLLHAVGKPALLQVVAAATGELKKARPSMPKAIDEAVRAVLASVLDELHTGVGLRIAALWGLPRPVVTAIASYAQLGGSPSGTPHASDVSEEAAITCLADRLATDLTEPGTFDDETLRDHPVFRRLNLYPDDVTGLLAKRGKVAETVESLTT